MAAFRAGKKPKTTPTMAEKTNAIAAIDTLESGIARLLSAALRTRHQPLPSWLCVC